MSQCACFFVVFFKALWVFLQCFLTTFNYRQAVYALSAKTHTSYKVNLTPSVKLLPWFLGITKTLYYSLHLYLIVFKRVPGNSVSQLIEMSRYTFNPPEDELINYYLNNKITENDDLVGRQINEVNICHHEPADLPGKPWNPNP